MGRMENKVTIITGASSGLGSATCKLFAAEGAKVVGLARRKDRLEALAEEITASGGEFTPMVCDLFSSAEIKDCVNRTVEKYSRIDSLINIAGVTDHLRFVCEITDDLFEYTINGNLRSTFYMCREVLPHMIKQKGGTIVNCSSIGGVKGYGGGAAYSMAKHGVVGLGRVICAEYSYDGIRCNTVCPGGIKTAMGANLLDPSRPENLDENGKLIAGNWLARCWPYSNSKTYREYGIDASAEPEVYAPTFLFLASEESAFINGEEIIAAGGATIR